MPIVDLSFPIRPHFRWKVAPEQGAIHAKGDPLQSTVVTISCHAYTHVDAPLHFLREGRDIATMPVDQWIGDAAVVDLTHLGANGEVSAEELERHGGHIKRGDIGIAVDGPAPAHERGQPTLLAGGALHGPHRPQMAGRARG